MVPDLEKTGYGYAEQQEQKKVYSDVDSQDAYVEEYTPEEQRKIIHRIDRRLVTTVGLMYCISLMDRTNLSAAAIAGMTVELRLNVAGFFPGCVYLLSTWYVRYDVGKRYSCFYFSDASPPHAPVTRFSSDYRMYSFSMYSLRWIFIIEGILTCIVAALGYVFLVTFPDSPKAANSWRFLNASDAATEPFSLKKFVGAGLDLKVWGFAIIFMCLTIIAYALAYFLPIILRNRMGFSVGAAQCLAAPPYAFAGIVMYATAWVGDKYHVRGPILILNAVLTLIGLPLMGFHSNVAVRYFGVFLTTAGANANIPACMAYQANNIRGQWKRAFCSATLVGFGGIGGIAGSLVFRSQDAPAFHPGLYACITASLLIIVVVILLDIKFYFDNKKQARGELIIEGSESGFRFTY
ncbi:hypothetical protein LTS18_003938 [Coniosporium uncinatum]|uniref:Uncharacterized protein n=1 Tax=Coniosporium uncinatum TaxID=93489 RepID=A0ACC3DYH7_9PEZI|nr:hypothetical protein LTS18_003938 [Coniosporium uncinatum]